MIHDRKIHFSANFSRCLLACLVSLWLASCGSSSDTSSVEEDDSAITAPNILLIIADDLGLDASAQYSYSSDVPSTPTLNQLALDGLVFENAWATPACTTTRGTLITGKHGVNSGVDTVPNLMDSTTLTLQRFLSQNISTSEYQSAVIGKWHLGGGNPDASHPNESGVPFYAGNISGVLDDYNLWSKVTNGVTAQSNIYHTSEITDTAINWVGAQTKPWFLWLAYVAPHSPFHLPPETLHERNLSGTTEDISTNPRQYYLAAIEAMDTEIGRLLDSLSSETKENTLIVFIGDNGTPRLVVDTSVFSSNKAKNTLYEGGIRVPMIVSGAGVSRKGQRESALVNTVDIYPTFLEASGASQNSSIDGQSFFSLLSDTQASQRQYNYSEFMSNAVSGWTVRNNEYKLIEFDTEIQELYSLEIDLKEDNNLIESGTTGYETIIAELSGYASQIRNE